MQAAHFAKSMNQHFSSPEIHTSLHRLQQQQQHQTPAKEPLSHLYSKFPYGMYDPYAAHESADKGNRMMMMHNHHHAHGASSSDESEDMSDHPSSGCVLDHQPSHYSQYRQPLGHHQQLPHQQLSHHGEFLPTATVEMKYEDMKYEDVRSLNEVDDEFTDHASHMDFDDVFLQISPDYGCLV